MTTRGCRRPGIGPPDTCPPWSCGEYFRPGLGIRLPDPRISPDRAFGAASRDEPHGQPPADFWQPPKTSRKHCLWTLSKPPGLHLIGPRSPLSRPRYCFVLPRFYIQRGPTLRFRGQFEGHLWILGSGPTSTIPEAEIRASILTCRPRGAEVRASISHGVPYDVAAAIFPYETVHV